jgi:hypothetical protein
VVIRMLLKAEEDYEEEVVNDGDIDNNSSRA